MRCEISVILHATEDEEKVLSRLFEVLKLKESECKVSRRSVSGHYGNPITYLTISVRRGDDLFTNVLRGIDSIDKLELRRNLDEYIEGSKLYLRLDKQALCAGRLRLSSIDAIRLMFRGVKREKVRKLLGEAEG